MSELLFQNYATLTPAHGKDYTSAKAVKEAFDEGKDFYLNTFNQGTTLINKEQIQPGTTISLRYKKLTMVVNYKVK